MIPDRQPPARRCRIPSDSMSDEPVLDRLETPDTTDTNGSEPKQRTHTFTHDGVDPLTVNINPKISTIALLELGAMMGMGEDAGNEYATAVWAALGDVLAKGELRRFKAWAKQADPTMGELLRMIGGLVAEVVGRPFEGQPPSQRGQPTTPTGSTGPGDAEPVTPAGEASAL